MAVRVQEAASLRLDEIYRYTRDRWGAEQADRYITDLFAAFGKIEVHGVASRPIPAEFAIDGFYFRSSFDRYKTLALINPEHPVELSNEIEKECGIPIVIMDANDIDQNQLGKCDDFPLTDDQIQDAMKDNPSGQGGELTPLILIRPLA